MTDRTLFNAGNVNEIKPGKTKRVVHNGKALLISNVDGNFHTIDDMCTHEDSSLYLGCLKGDEIQCSLHGGRFNVITGEATVEPAEVALKVYRTLIENDNILIDLGD